MKKILLLILSLGALQMTHAQKSGQLVIKGDLSQVKEKIAQVKIYANKGVDSCKVINGKYAFDLLLEKPSQVMLEFCPTIGISPVTDGKNMLKYRHYMYFEPGTKTVTSIDSMFTCITTGSPTDDAYQTFLKKYNAMMVPFQQMQEEIMAYYQKKDTVTAERLIINFSRLQDSTIANFCIDYVLNDLSNPILFYILSKAYGFPFNIERTSQVFEKLPAHLQNSPEGMAVKEKIDNASRIAIGKMAPDFTQTDTSGNPVSLASFRGKYVLLDFWGSWCGFCRQESPYMIRAFNKYKDKGFTIIAVATDKDKSKWLGAIHKDGTGLWTHVSDLSGTDNAVSKLYSVVAYPTSYLIDPTGKIIAQDMRGDDLEKKLAEVIK